MEIKAADNIVVVLPVEGKQVSGSFLETSQKRKPELGEIIVLGRPSKDKRLPVEGMKVGDLIAYRRFGESKFFIDGGDKIFVGFEDVLAVIEKGEDAK